MTALPVLDVGGTHVTGCRVDTNSWQRLPEPTHRMPLYSHGTAEQIVSTLAACGRTLGPMTSAPMVVAMPGPFDYAAGVGRFRNVGKFDALAGLDVRAALLASLLDPPGDIIFVNDAEAFGLGEWLSGAARDYERAVAITLGSGVGSAFVDAGRVVSSGPRVPPDGHVYRISIGEHQLEEVVSRRAIIAAYREANPDAAPEDLDVREIAVRALGDDEAASHILREAFRRLGAALAPWLTRFRAQILVIGGGITGAWSLIEAPLRQGLGNELDELVVVKAQDSEASTAIGAAWHASRKEPHEPGQATPPIIGGRD